MNSFAVAVVIASHRPQFIGDLLLSLNESIIQSNLLVQVIVVADYEVKEFSSAFPNVVWKFLNDISISAKRNLGCSYAESDLIAFVDDDCKVDNCWILTGYQYLHDNPDIAAVEGKTTVEVPDDAPGMIKEYKRLEKPGFRTNNLFYRKSVFVDAGCFDERFTVQREDLDLAFSVLTNNGKIAFCEQLKVNHRFRKGEWWDLLKNAINRRFDPLLYKKFPYLYRKYVKTPFPKSYLLLLFVHIITLISFIADQVTFFIVADLLFSSALASRRSGFKVGYPKRFFPELFCVLLAPFLFLVSLVYGSIKFRKFLLL